MPTRGWPTALGLAAACTSSNPAFESTGEDTIGQAESTATPTSDGAITSAGPTSGGTADTHENADETEGSSDGPLQQETCLADLYAINDLGTLYLLDVDAVTAIPMIDQDQELKSWAMATHPQTGVIYISQYDDPGTLWRVSPLVFSREPAPVSVPSGNVVELARAAFVGSELWLGTDDTNLFVAFTPDAGPGSELTKEGPGRGGDLLFLDGTTALVPSLDGNVWLARFDVADAPVAFPIVLVDMPWIQQFTGIARDRQDRPWASTVEGLLVRLEIDGLPARPPTPVEVIDFGITIHDLAPIVTLPGGC